MGGDEAVPERLSMFTRGRLIVAASALGALSIAGASVGVPAASASASSVASKPITGVLSTSAAKQLGFPKTIQKPTSSSKTGQAGCPKAAAVLYEDSVGKTGLESEILSCNTQKAVTTALASLQKSVTVTTAQKPPKQLGSSAIEVSSGQATYAIVWQRGKVLSVMALDVNVPATSSSTTTTTPTPTPLTAAQQKTLSNAALAQDKSLQ
jgi:hypothetical protein